MHIRTQLVMSEDLRLWEHPFEVDQQVMERDALLRGARIGGDAILVQSALVADSDGMQVEPFCMRPDLMQRSAMMEHPVAGDVKMITYVPESALQVAATELFDGEGNIAARCAAMDDEHFNLAWQVLSGHDQIQDVMPIVPAMVVNTVMTISMIFFQIPRFITGVF